MTAGVQGVPKALKLALCSACLALPVLAGPADAHHSFSMFDRSKTAQVAGTVKSFEMINPHGWLQVMVADGQGRAHEWSLEMNAPVMLQRAGWKESSVSPGDKVTAVIYPLKDGSNGGQLVSVTLPGGQTLTAGGPPGGRGFGAGQ